ncbi:MAG: putative toxin-antitoxin system toxin component, PIN family [Gemmatimonadetes bacterium]|nr:putative toxin-antitoxin system toxin component, PIN family [Gemmatimonadota bacterium]
MVCPSSRPRFPAPARMGDGRFLLRHVDREGRAVYVAQLEAVSEWVPNAGAKLGCRDPDDDKLLETALMGAADCLVTGDWDLLEMSPFPNIPILSPTGFPDLRTVR